MIIPDKLKGYFACEGDKLSCTIDIDNHSEQIKSPDFWPEISKFVLSATTITKIDCAYNKLNVDTAIKIINALSRTTIKSIDFVMCNWGQDNKKIAELFSALKSTNIEEFALRLGAISGESAKAIAKSLAGNNILKKINLEYNNIGLSGAAALIEGLNSTNVMELNLTKNKIGSDIGGIGELVESLKYNKTLKKIILCENKLKNIETQELAEIVKYNMTLTHLILNQFYSQSQDILTESALEFSKALQRNPVIIDLGSKTSETIKLLLQENKDTPEKAIYRSIGYRLVDLTRDKTVDVQQIVILHDMLKSVKLDLDQIFDDVVISESIAKKLEGWKNINNITDIIGKFIGQNTNKLDVDFSKRSIDWKDLNIIFHTLQKHQGEKTINLAATKIMGSETKSFKDFIGLFITYVPKVITINCENSTEITNEIVKVFNNQKQIKFTFIKEDVISKKLAKEIYEGFRNLPA